MTSTTDEDLVPYRREGAIAILTLNRPDRLNAFSDELVRALVDALARFDDDRDARVAVLHGAGRAFSSGADVAQRQMRSRDELERLGGPEGRGARGADVFTQAVNWKPVVAAVHGYAIGMGLGIALSADLIVVERGTRMQVTETSRGLSPVRYGYLLRARGLPSFAWDVSMTGRWFTAEEAREAGVVELLVDAGRGLATAIEVATAIAANPPLSVRAAVRARRMEIDQGERRAAALTDPMKLHLTEDFAESARAFIEKRPPRPYRGA
ncbi:MAG: enoyl-CoA hydratase/isomerase family protein [Burkholderiaceae bacterium]